MAENASGTGTKRASIKTVDGKALESLIYRATFTNGTVVECDVAALPAEVADAMKHRLMMYGLKQKLDDSIAGVELADAPKELAATWEAICKGAWVTRTAGDGVEGGLFASAYAERHGISLGDAKAHIGKLVEKNLKATQEKQSAEDAADPKKAITDRMIFNKIREVALARDEKLAAIYEELKAKQKKKSAAKAALEVDIEDPEVPTAE